jgi:methylphosphotriester-DNA--protein-cysteine methyltransferase
MPNIICPVFSVCTVPMPLFTPNVEKRQHLLPFSEALYKNGKNCCRIFISAIPEEGCVVRLEKYSQWETNKPDEFRRHISQLMDRKFKVIQHQGFHAKMVTARLKHIVVSPVALTGSLSTVSTDTAYNLARMDVGGLERQYGSLRGMTVSPGEGALTVPGREATTTLRPTNRLVEAVMFTIPAKVVAHVMKGETGEPMTRPLELTSPANLHLETAFGDEVAVFLEDLNSGRFEEHPKWGEEQQYRFVATLIECTPNNYRDLVDRYHGGPARARAMAAEAYIADHIREGLTVTDVAAALNTNARTLREDCKRILQLTTIELIQKHRMFAMRWQLENPEPETTVASVARGLAIAGYFAGSYKKEYGETPHETLNRNRRKLGLTPEGD